MKNCAKCGGTSGNPGGALIHLFLSMCVLDKLFTRISSNNCLTFLCQCGIISPEPPDKSVYRSAYSSSRIVSIQVKMMFKIYLRIVMANEYFSTRKRPGKGANKQQFKIGMLMLTFSPHLSIYYCKNVTFD